MRPPWGEFLYQYNYFLFLVVPLLLVEAVEGLISFRRMPGPPRHGQQRRHPRQLQQQQWVEDKDDLDRCFLRLYCTTSENTDEDDASRHRHDHHDHDHPHQPQSQPQPQPQPHVIVVGKIIIDEYGNPDEEDNIVVVVDDDVGGDGDDDENENDEDDDESSNSHFIYTCTSSKNYGGKNITIGGGGPQAALGAALALATLQYQRRQEKDHMIGTGDDRHMDQYQDVELHNQTLSSPPPPPPPPSRPPKQPVTLLAAVGELDFGDDEIDALMNDLGGVFEGNDSCPSATPGVVLLKGQGCVTPKIRLWHEGPDQVLKWYAVDDSFGESGAGKLWKTVPSTDDYTGLILNCTTSSSSLSSQSKVSSSTSSTSTEEQSATARSMKPILHVICEAGPTAPGDNCDSLPLVNEYIRQSISCLGIEPILFPDDDGHVSTNDAVHCSNLLQSILNGQGMSAGEHNDSFPVPVPVPVIISPDKATFDAMAKNRCIPSTSSASSLSTFFLDSIVVREGPNGSTFNLPAEIFEKDGPDSTGTGMSFTSTHIPAATLRSLVNPTGAGNAYSAAFTTLRGSGCDEITSACIATGVGAVFCEYDHCPPYTYAVVERIHTASEEVLKQIQLKSRK